ncbi:MAG: hypothetical protein EAX95_14265 [Candidatus Thorarchaeota archaeon]|nr:hypothetical protein [Candidatus Thorarchaeota archaeon]
MTSVVKEQSLKQRIMLKALILGTDTALQAGFMTQACQQGVSLHMYPILGVALGISRREVDSRFEIVLQMWTIPVQERLPGLTKQFIRGHRAAIILIRPDEVESLDAMMEVLTEESKKNLLVVIVGSRDDDSEQIERASVILGADRNPVNLASIDDAMNVLVGHLSPESPLPIPFPLIALLDNDACPVLNPPLTPSDIEPSTAEEIETIRSTAESLGYRCSSTACTLNLQEGEIEVTLETGRVQFKPILCNYCAALCKKNVNICIVAVDKGWASEEIGGVAMLTLAKLVAFPARQLPEHVENQIRRACSCSEFEIAEGIPEMEGTFEELRALGYVRKGRRLTLLDEASRRVRNGNLPASALNTLRNSLKRVESSANDGEGQQCP